MAEKNYIYEVEGNTATITINRPEALNAMTFAMDHELSAELTKAEEDDDVKCIILKGAGPCFCAGHDLKEVGFVYGFGDGKDKKRKPSQRIRLQTDHGMMVKSYGHIQNCFKPIIAQVHGHCLEGGLIVAMMCDMIIATEDATLGFPGQRLGFAGNSPIVPHLVYTVGLKKARELLLLGLKFDGKEAERIGLINRVVPADKLEEEVQKVAKAICLMPRDGIVMAKSFLQLSYDRMGLNEGNIAGYIGHTLFTNLRWEEDEYNYFKERRQHGPKAGFHGRDARYEDTK